MDLLACLRRIAAGVLLAAPAVGAAAAAAEPGTDAEAFVEAVRRANEDQARKPGTRKEADLAALLPKSARAALDRVLAAPAGPEALDALEACAQAALDLDLVADFDRVRARLEKEAPDRAAKAGLALSRPRFQVRLLGGLERPYGERLADLLDAILDAYAEVFGFAEWSKVPGKKLRFRVHREPQIDRPPHFAPQFPFHSEVDFPVVDADAFRSPTPDGKFLFYGLCHELGHVAAMWGDAGTEEDHHAWAHYTGVVVVEHLSKTRKSPLVEGLRDVQWRSLEAERKAAAGRTPSLSDRDGVLATLVALHDAVGPKALGEALNRLDAKGANLRVNRVRYYRFKDLRAALLDGLRAKEKRKAVERLLP